MTRFDYPCHVRFSDVDVYGHVNNVKYFEYFQEARIELFTALGRGQLGGDFALVVARVDVDYKRPILLRSEPYLVQSRIARVGESSGTVVAEFLDGDTLLSRSEAVVVAFDVEEQRSRAWTDEEREQLLSVVED